MNVLRIIASMDPSSGGPCQGIRNLIPALEKLGVHNEVVSLDDPGSSFLGNDSFSIVALGPVKGPWLYCPSLIPWLHENLHRFDLVIVHGLWLYHSYAVGKVMRNFRVRKTTSKEAATYPKVFIMPHGMLDPYFQRAPDRRMKAIRNWVYWKLIEGKVINESDGVLFTCEAELLLARQTFSPYFPKREINVGYGIKEPPAYNPKMREVFLEKCPAVRDHPYILFLSRIHEKKGVDLLVKAFADSIGENPPKLVIAGPGLDTPYGQRIQQLVSQAPALNNLIFFPGMLSGDAKWGAFYGSEAFALPSHQENFGIAVVEALACGKPVLISSQVNIWREIEAKGGGLVEEDTAEGTNKLLNRWLRLRNEDKLRYARQARETYHSCFDIESTSRQWISSLQIAESKSRIY